MRNAIITFGLLIFVQAVLHAAGRDLMLSREMLEDAIIRDDADGIDLARGRLLAIIADSNDRTVLRDANYLVALSAVFESFNAYRDAASAARVATQGIRHADRAIELDPQFADAWMMSSALRFTAARLGVAAAKDPPGAPNRVAHATELDPKSPAVAFYNGIFRSMNPNGPANPEGIRIFDDLAARLDTDRAATGRRFGLWDAEARAWQILVRLASDEPRGESLRASAQQLLQQRPDFVLGQQIAAWVAERRFVAAPAVTWQPFLTDAAGDGKNPNLPDVVSVDRAESGERLWYRVTFREKLPRSFGLNIVANRTGDPAKGMQWWGTGSTFHFDRLVTAWITREGDDRYFGRAGVTDEDGARTARPAKLSDDVQLAMSDDGRSVMVGVPRDVLGLTTTGTVIVAGGSHLVWNDDATSPANSR